MNYFQCNQCQSRFKKKERLEQHMLKKHSDFECETCGKKFPEQGSLKEHVRVCLSFKRSQNVHIFCFQVHTGERPHQCTECGATFSFQSNFISHRFEVLNTKTSQKSFPGKCTSENRDSRKRRQNSGSTIFVTPAARTTQTRYDNIISS